MKLIVWLLCLYPLLLSAQESDIFKLMLKETLRPELPLNFSFDFSDSIFLRKPMQFDITKDYISRLGFNYEQNHLLLSYKEDPMLVKSQTISPYLITPYSNQEKFDPNSTETTNDMIVNVLLTPVGSIIMLNPGVFFDFLVRAGVLPDEPFVPKKSKKEQRLKTITQDVYHIDDDY